MSTTSTTEGAHTSEGYNGWSNYETWAVALWLDNEESTYHYTRDLARDAYDDATETTYATRGQAAAWSLAETLKAEHDDANPLTDGTASVFSDLLSAALGRVDWHEIAHNLVTEVLGELEAEDVPDDTEGDCCPRCAARPELLASLAAQGLSLDHEDYCPNAPRSGGLLDELRQAERWADLAEGSDQ